ncbi:transcription/translation regulatory transformer protein RfaH [Vibrio sp. Of7-15]|uniref:transcription/translation regulatory transformer protein RfaH n=1 Tax=Vibrio sp. Of7-15 TaxID=2724879 RepID=UPI001EF36697|nr:transcription/translation regulatory transformer protein RfaH [Vibrio sp. Of7-15]MCG7495763.1 transcription/translation regulatory transformer protein RfaH [Vibrio sp. Of7-15]
MKRWYLLYCKRSEQQRAVTHLERQGVECYFPEIDIEKMSRGKRTKAKEPLFPCYVFVRFDYEVGPTFTTIRSTRGVSDFVRLGPHPKELEGDLIYSLKTLSGDDVTECAESLPEPGQKVAIKEGPFVGVEAIYQEPDGEKRSILLIQLIGKTVKKVVENKDLEF